jgi:hypothetical protein
VEQARIRHAAKNSALVRFIGEGLGLISPQRERQVT